MIVQTWSMWKYISSSTRFCKYITYSWNIRSCKCISNKQLHTFFIILSTHAPLLKGGKKKKYIARLGHPTVYETERPVMQTVIRKAEREGGKTLEDSRRHMWFRGLIRTKYLRFVLLSWRLEVWGNCGRMTHQSLGVTLALDWCGCKEWPTEREGQNIDMNYLHLQ